ncbi:MAG: carboxypeptidase-like regulatory domain-containing protein [Bacteroidota bacterium]|nr:carboxypeptidase-like regulatory domain-containing protein [Bacteroidota bacterium]
MQTRHFLLILVITIMACMFFACDNEKAKDIETADLRVTVFDTLSNPVPGVEVKLFNDVEYTLISNNVGQCVFTNLFLINTIIKAKKEHFIYCYENVSLFKGDNYKTIILEPIETFFEGFETDSSLAWLPLEGTGWVRTNSMSHSGNYCAKYIDQNAYILTVVEIESEPMILSFWYKYNIDPCNAFQFGVNGMFEISQSGYTDWQQHQTVLTQGTYMVYWTVYADDGYYGETWVDDISLTTINK